MGVGAFVVVWFVVRGAWCGCTRSLSCAHQDPDKDLHVPIDFVPLSQVVLESAHL